jgi:hypothetical protein
MFKKVLFLVLLSQVILFAQKNNHEVKLNLSGLGLKIAGLQYEYRINKSLAFNSTFFYRGQSLIPFANTIDKFGKNEGIGLTGIKFNYIFLNEAQLGLAGLSPELKFYLGKKNSFFLGAFGMYSNYKLNVPASLPVRYNGQILEVITPVNIRFSSYSGGLNIGWKIGKKRLFCDLVLMGPHFGKAGNFLADVKNENFSRLNNEDLGYLKEKIEERFGVSPEYFETSVAQNGAEIRSIKKIPFIGIRGLGVNIGYRIK